MMVLKKSAARMVAISSWAAAMASGEGVCARAGPAANKQTTTQTVGIHECLRMKSSYRRTCRDHTSPRLRRDRQRTTCARSSIHREADVLDQLAVARVIAADAPDEIRKRGDVGIAGSGGRELVHDIRLRENRIHLLAQPRHDRRRRGDRREQTLPDRDFVT